MLEPDPRIVAELYRTKRDASFARTSQRLAVLVLAQWVLAVLVAVTLSPLVQKGEVTGLYHVWVAVIAGGLVTAIPVYLTRTRPSAAITRYATAVAQMVWSGLYIHLLGGRIESHFHVFASLALLALYRDWRVLVPATIVILADHVVRQLFWPESVFGISNPEWWRTIEHALWILLEDAILIAGCMFAARETYRSAHTEVAMAVLSEQEATKSHELQTALDRVEILREAQLRTEKLAAIGQLAASVGHELRNPLAAIRNANTYIIKKLQNSDEPRVKQFGQLIESELDVCAKIISDLLDFARERPLVLAPTPLRDLVEEVCAMVSTTSTVSLRNHVPGDLAVPTVDRDQFRQMIFNIVLNAVEAIEATEPRDSAHVTIAADKPGASWRLTIQDDGPGIPGDVVSRIFEPLFTTKIKGTGLGLAIVASIVERHGGTIDVDSAPGRGTKLVIEWTTPERVSPPTAMTAA
jgi:two-component system, NtrC family, sensor histidine kinase HydH